MKNVEDIYPLSPLQEGMLVESLLDPAEDLYFRQFTLRLEGELDGGLFERAWRRVAARHTALRTAFLWDGFERPLQVVNRQADLPFEHRDWRDLTGERQRLELAGYLRQDQARGFDLARAPLMRIALMRLAPEAHRLVWTHHHLILDGWSRGLVLQEVLGLYEELRQGRDPVPVPAPPFRDYLAWLQRQDTAVAERFWRRQLGGFSPPPAAGAGRVAARSAMELLRATLPAATATALDTVARRRQVAAGTLVHAAWALLLRHHLGEEDVVFGSVFHGRSAALPEIDSRVGMMISSLPLRVRMPAAAPVGPWLRDLQQQFNELRGFEHSSLTDVRAWSGLPRSQPLFETLVVFQPPAFLEQGTAALRVRDLHLESETSNHALSLMALPRNGLELHLLFDRRRCDAVAAGRLLAHLTVLLTTLAGGEELRLGDVDPLSEAERHQLLCEWNDPLAVAPWHGPVHRLFERRAAAAPDAPAVRCGAESLTFAELDRRAGRLASRLRGLGVGPDVRVALYLDRSPALVVAILGVLKAGGAYLPVDPAYPEARAAFLLEDSAAAVVVTGEERLAALPSSLPDPPAGPARVLTLESAEAAAADEGSAAEEAGVAPENLAYVLYTSGSTGRPKGVLVSHAGLGSYLHWAVERYGRQGAEGGSLVHTSVSFDLTVTSLLLPLISGAPVVLVPEGPGVEELARALQSAAPPLAFLKLTPSHARLLAQQPEAEDLAGRSRGLILGGEGLSGEDLELWRAAAPRTWVCNEYGPTEAVVGCCVWEAAAGDLEPGPAPIGRPATPHGRVYVLDRDLRPVAVGVTGEICLGGAALARGYHARPALTAERFLPDSCGGEAGGRLYRTGDLARLRPDGVLEYLGRGDSQVKVRGYRVELGEVEAVLARHPAVGRAAAVLRGEGDGRRLVAYAEPRGAATAGPAPEPHELAAFLRRELPEPMVPAAVVWLAALPLSPNGKVDRGALPDPDPVRLEGGGRVAPRTPAEEVLAGVWSQILGVEGVGAHDDFFALGGHSLLATRLTSRLRQLFGADLSLRDVFEAPRLADLAARLETLRGGAAPPSSRRREPVLPVPRDPGGLPLSFGQQRLWFLDQLYPGCPLYNVPGTLRLAGPLAVAALARTLEEIAGRHEVLRTVFRQTGGEPRQVVLPAAAVPLPSVDLAGLPADAARREAAALAGEEARRPFDLARGPVLRATLLRLAPREHVLFLAMHHIVSDGWSMGLLIDELEAGYSALREARPAPLAPLPVQYADFAVWQRRQREAWSDQLAYWRRQLAGVPLLELPADRPRPAVPGLRGDRVYFRLSQELAEAVGRLARREGATPFMVALAALQGLLARYSGQDDFCVGSPIAGRTRVETERLIGFFLNTLPLRARLAGGPAARALLARVRETALDAHANQELPFEHLVEELQPDRDLSHTPLFQVLFTFQNAWPQALRLPGLEVERLESRSGTAKFDLSWVLAPRPDGMTGYVEFPVDRFGAGLVGRMVEHFRMLLAGFAAAPERRVADLDLLTPAERHQLLAERNATAVRFPEHTGAHALFEAWAAREPGRIAAASGEESLTYGELEARANRLARHLRALGVGPEVPVALALDRSLDLVVALLAVLKAGGVYVPLDLRQPAGRLEWILADSRPALVVTRTPWLELAGGRPAVCLDRDAAVIAAREPAPPVVIAAPESLAYLIYTSGSTGRPKGVAVEHRQVLNYVQGLVERLGLTPGLVYATVSTFGADLGNTSVFGALCHGGTLHVVPEDLVLDAGGLARYLERHEVDVLKIVPSHLQALRGAAAAGAGDALLPRRLLVLGGEASPGDWVAELLAAGRCAVANHYGPSETTVGVMTHPAVTGAWQPGAALPLGRPLPNSRTYVLGPELAPLPVWVPGELCVGGEGVSRGYLHQPALTAERFVPDPHAAAAGARLYRTGDLARLLPDGTVEFLGRIDHQVKFHGHRIELEGVRHLLREHPLVRDGVVRLLRDGEGRDVLVAYYVARQPVAAEELRGFLGRHLVEETLPSLFVHLRRLPLGLNGKVSLDALPSLAEIRGRLQPQAAPPESATAEILTGIWCQVLGLERVAPDDSFFAVGGHSLLATQVVARVREAMGVELPLRALFEQPTVRALSAHLDRLLGEAGGPAMPPLAPVERGADLPLSFTQTRMWLQDRLRPGTSFYNVAGALRLRGELVVAAWQQSLTEIARRHEVLRTVYPRRGDGVAQVVLPASPVPLPVVDLSQLPETRRQPEVERLSREEARRPFDLAAGPLLRARLIAAGPREHVLLFVLHHIAGDGLSIGVLARELGELSAAFSAGRPSPLEELPVQYADFAAWQRGWFQGEVLARQVDFWRRQLAGAPEALELPTDRPRPAVQSSWGDRLAFRLPSDLTQAVRAVSRASGATLFMTLLAAFKVVLRHLSGQDDLVVGTNVASRQHAVTERMIGCFINQLVLRTRLTGGDSFRRLVARVKDGALAAYAHQDLPFEKLVEELKPRRDPGRPLLYQVKVELLNRQPIDRCFRHVEVSRFSVDHPVVRYDLHLAMSDDGGELTGLLHYNTDLFEAATVRRVADCFETVLAAATADPELSVDALCDLLAGRERSRRERREAEVEALSGERLRQLRRRGASGERERAR